MREQLLNICFGLQIISPAQRGTLHTFLHVNNDERAVMVCHDK
jgi:hypothetical protein